MGETAVAAFAVITYLGALIIGIFMGVSQGLQPLIGKCFGSGDEDGLRFYFRSGIAINAVLAALVYCLMLVAGKWIYAVFNPDAGLVQLADSIWRYNALAYVFASVNIVYTTYFFSTKQTGKALAVAAGRSIVLNVACIFAFPLIFASQYIWLAIVASEVIVIALSLTLKNIELRMENRPRLGPVVVTQSSGRWAGK